MKGLTLKDSLCEDQLSRSNKYTAGLILSTLVAALFVVGVAVTLHATYKYFWPVKTVTQLVEELNRINPCFICHHTNVYTIKNSRQFKARMKYNNDKKLLAEVLR